MENDGPLRYGPPSGKWKEGRSVSESGKTPSKTWDAVLVDDDALVAAAWRLSARTAGKALLVCRGGAEFWQHADGLPLATPLYVDRQLDWNDRREDGLLLAEQMHARGFSRIVLTTGGVLPVALPSWMGRGSKRPPWSDAGEPMLESRGAR